MCIYSYGHIVYIKFLNFTIFFIYLKFLFLLLVQIVWYILVYKNCVLSLSIFFLSTFVWSMLRAFFNFEISCLCTCSLHIHLYMYLNMFTNALPFVVISIDMYIPFVVLIHCTFGRFCVFLFISLVTLLFFRNIMCIFM